MRLRRPRFAVESLENRSTPAVFATLNAGALSVSGLATTPGDTISVVETAYNVGTKTGTFKVYDGAAQVGPVGGFAVTRDVLIQLTAADDNLQVNLGGFKAPGAITSTLGNGNNTYNLIGGGTVTGLVNVTGGTGTDNFTLGDGANVLTLNGVNLNPGTETDTATLTNKVTTGSVAANAAETLNVNSGATVGGTIATTGVATVNIPAGATINGNATFGTAAGPVSVTLGGLAKGSFTVNGAAFTNLNTIDLSVTATGQVLGNLFLNSGAYNVYGFMTLDIAGSVGGQVSVAGGGGSDSINVTGTIGVALNAYLYGGNDIVTVTGATIGTAGQKFYAINLDMGAGEDTVDLSGSTLKGGLLVKLGTGDDSFKMTSATATQEASPYRFFLDAGAGVDNFIDTSGVYTKTGPNTAVVKILNFETP